MTRDGGAVADGPAAGSVAEVGEFGLIAKLTAESGSTRSPSVTVGPGDDAAVLGVEGALAITCDVLVEGVHFRRDWSTPIDVGRRAAAASLADIAAMGARPTALVVGLAIPGDVPASWAVGCAAAMREEAASVDAQIVGGDVVSAPQIVLSVTATGTFDGREPVLRTGARAGDVLAIAGRTGWAAAGLAVLSRGFRSPKALVDAQRFPEPDYSAGPRAALAGATAMIDVSDGLVADARHLAEASGVDVDIDTSDWEIPEALAAAAAAYNVDPREWMLTGGEDHALLATFPAGVDLPDGFRAIGTVRAAEDESSVSVDGQRRTDAGGHRHFA